MLGLDYIARHHPKTRKKITKSFVPTECLAFDGLPAFRNKHQRGPEGRKWDRWPAKNSDSRGSAFQTDLCRGLLSFPPVLWLPVWAILHTAMHTTITMP